MHCYVERISYRSEKIPWLTLADLVQCLNALGARRIISITSCTPEYTNLSQWSLVYYEYDV